MWEMRGMTMFKSGELVAQFIEPLDGSELEDEQIQPNGVDLTVGDVKRIVGPAILESEHFSEPENRSVELKEGENYDYYQLRPSNIYKVLYGEKIKIPTDHVGIVFPRSRLLRSGVHLTTALWDCGYEGGGEGGLYCNNIVTIEEGMRIGQMCFVRASQMREYDGSFQGERL